jgi:outer membrane protein TolC
MLFRKLKIHIRKLGIAAIVFLVTLHADAQMQKTITLDNMLKMANQNSLDAFKAKRQYAIKYWEYRSFQSQFLPRVDLDVAPVTFTRSLVKRYDVIENVDRFIQQQNLLSFSQLSISQNIIPTGTKVFINSSINRLINYGDNRVINYSTTPINIGIEQPLMAFNELKWTNKTALLEYEKAKKDYIYESQKINLDAIKLFFDWSLSTAKVEIAKETKKNAERMYKIALKRYDIGAIERDDLLNLELEQFTSKTNLLRETQQLQTIIADIKLFLIKEDLDEYEPQLPELISNLKISLEEAIQFMNTNNPDLLETAIKSIDAERDLDKVIKENRFDLSISASYGLNQQSDNFRDAYRNFLDQQIVGVTFSMPILDWGERKGLIKTARMTKELADIEIQQTINDVKRQLVLKVNNFNLQEEQVLAALRSKEISKESFDITQKRFLSGKVDLLRLLNSRKAWQDATEQYIESLKLYWTYYYEVQQLTLYSFANKKTLQDSFEFMLRD